jgi:hypothetical protein
MEGILVRRKNLKAGHGQRFKKWNQRKERGQAKEMKELTKGQEIRKWAEIVLDTACSKRRPDDPSL